MSRFFFAAIFALCFATSAAIPLVSEESIQSGIGPEKVKNWSGYLDVHGGDRHLFYWMFESRGSPETDPFILWMTGGPGCSGMVALFYENGPYQIQDDLSLKLNPYSWNSNANVMWIDQPVGAGFSYSDFGDLGVVTEKAMAEDMHEFLQTFMAKYPKYSKSEFFIFGESYGGHYVPALSVRINEGNKAKEGLHINLKGSAIGNGLVHPELQYPQYAEFAKMHKLVPDAEISAMKAVLPVCEGLIHTCAKNGTAALKWAPCLAATEACNLGEMIPIKLTGINLYDYTIKCEHPPLCYDFDPAGKLLNDKTMQAALGVKRKWESCNMLTNLKFSLAGDWMQDLSQGVPQLLADGIRVLVYAGENDFICNWLGNQAWVDALEWEGKAAFAAATNATWTAAGKAAGSLRSADGLTFLRVFDAGHMVPMNQPAASLEMVNKFIAGQPLA